MKQEYQLTRAKKAILILSVLIPAMIFILGTLLPKKPSSSMLNDSFWANKIDNDRLYDVVAIGDSRIYRGINPEIIGNQLHLSVFNYGFSSAGLDSNLLGNAVKLLDQKGEKVLLIGVSPSSFTMASLRNEHLLSLKKITAKDLWIRKNIYPYLTFFETYSLTDLRKIMLNENYFQTFYKNGFVYSIKTPHDTFQALNPYIQFMNKNSQDRKAIQTFLQQIQQIQSKGIKCYGFRVPISAPLRELENKFFDFPRFEKDFTDTGGEWLTFPFTGWNSYDGSHLDGRSANKLSELLSDSLVKYLEPKKSGI